MRLKTHKNCISTSIRTELQMQTNQVQIGVSAESYAQFSYVLWDMDCDNEWRGNEHSWIPTKRGEWVYERITVAQCTIDDINGALCVVG